jgi:hypothetical protein
MFCKHHDKFIGAVWFTVAGSRSNLSMLLLLLVVEMVVLSLLDLAGVGYGGVRNWRCRSD